MNQSKWIYDPRGMFTRWWNWLVDEHAEAEGKTVKKYRIVKGEIVRVPSAEVRPVRHGKWTHERLVSTSGGTYAVVRCSECKWQHPMLETKFCPNCGARMDQKESR